MSIPSFQEFMETEPQRCVEQHEDECGCDEMEDCWPLPQTLTEWYEESYLAYFPEAEEIYPRPEGV